MAKSCTIENPKAAKSVAGLTVYLSSPPNDLMASQEIASELLKVVGSEESDPLDKSESYAIINKSTKTAVISVLLKLIESVIVDVDWAITKLKAFSVISLVPVCANEHDRGEKAPALILEEALYLRSEALVNLLSFFAHMNLTDTQAEQYLRLTARLYKHLALMTKLRIAPKGFKQLLRGFQFQKLVETTCQRLTAPLYNFVFLIQKKQQESAPSKGIISKIKRENRCVPDLIFQIEDYEKYLIQLTKLTKINLLRHAKRSTIRDFKIVDTNKLNIQEEEAGRESSPVKSVASENELCEDPEGEEGNEYEKALSPELDAAAAAVDSGSDSEETDISFRRKRAKTSGVVQDSNDEA